MAEQKRVGLSPSEVSSGGRQGAGVVLEDEASGAERVRLQVRGPVDGAHVEVEDAAVLGRHLPIVSFRFVCLTVSPSLPSPSLSLSFRFERFLVSFAQCPDRHLPNRSIRRVSFGPSFHSTRAERERERERDMRRESSTDLVQQVNGVLGDESPFVGGEEV